MLGHIVALGIGIAVGIVLMQFLICVWNEINLDMRRNHRFLAEEYIKMGRSDLAKSHIRICQRLSKWFIRRGAL